MIAGTYDDIQGGICWGPIAHAPRPRLQPAAWFSGNDSVRFPDISLTALSKLTFQATLHWGGQKTYTLQILFTAPINNGSILIGYITDSQSWICQWLTPGGAYRGRLVSNTPLVIGVKHVISILFDFVGSTISVVVDGNNVTAPIINYVQLTPGTICEVGNRNSPNTLYPYKGTIYDISLVADAGSPISITGRGILTENWNGGTLLGSLERCLIRGDGAVILNNIIQNP